MLRTAPHQVYIEHAERFGFSGVVAFGVKLALIGTQLRKYNNLSQNAHGEERPDTLTRRRSLRSISANNLS